MPDDARGLIEGVYSPEAEETIPEALMQASRNAEGEYLADAGLASANALDITSKAYQDDHNAWWEEARTPTRLGEDTQTVYLACLQDGQLVPKANTTRYPWQNSSMQVAIRLIGGEDSKTEADPDINRIKEQLPAGGRWGTLLVLRETGHGDYWTATATDSHEDPITIYYSERLGLMTDAEYRDQQQEPPGLCHTE